MCWRLSISFLTVLCVSGCGAAPAPQHDLELVRRCVETGLNSWQRGEKLAPLKSDAAPIEFHDDDWKVGVALNQFDLVNTYVDRDGLPRCSVVLTVKRQNGKVERKEVTYQILPGEKYTIARDPYS